MELRYPIDACIGWGICSPRAAKIANAFMAVQHAHVKVGKAQNAIPDDTGELTALDYYHGELSEYYEAANRLEAAIDINTMSDEARAYMEEKC